MPTINRKVVRDPFFVDDDNELGVARIRKLKPVLPKVRVQKPARWIVLVEDYDAHIMRTKGQPAFANAIEADDFGRKLVESNEFLMTHHVRWGR